MASSQGLSYDMASSRGLSSSSGEDFVEILEVNESYEEVNGSHQFVGTLFVYRAAGSNKLYHGYTTKRYPGMDREKIKLKVDDLNSHRLIPSEAYSPLFPASGLTRAPDSLPEGSFFVERPRLTSYDGSQGSEIADKVLAEAKVCELLKQNPHPNIATYLGCQVSEEGRIIGLLFAGRRHHTTLMKEVNPRSLGKRHFKSVYQGGGGGGRGGRDFSHVLDGVESGLKHLHGLGLVHNDISPASIILEGDDGIITGFRSCRRIGEDLSGTSGTYEWYDEKITTSQPKRDLDALEEIRIWLGISSKPFQFEE